MTSFQREAICDFSLGNPFYIGATVSFYTIDSNGDATTTLATLYAGISGADTLANPQKLGSEGRFVQPVYVAEPVIGVVTPKNAVNSHATGVIHPDLGVDAASAAQASAEQASSYTAVIQELYARVKSAVNSLSGITAFGLSLIESDNAAAGRTVMGAQQDVITTRGDLIRGNSGGAAERLALGSAGHVVKSDGADLIMGGQSEVLVIACTGETAALTTGTAKVTFRMPFAMTVSAVRGSLSTAQTSGSVVTVDINEGGASILSTKMTFDNGEKTTTTAAAAAVISDTALADDAEMTIDIDQVGDGTAAGLKVAIIGTRA